MLSLPIALMPISFLSPFSLLFRLLMPADITPLLADG